MEATWLEGKRERQWLVTSHRWEPRRLVKNCFTWPVYASQICARGERGFRPINRYDSLLEGKFFFFPNLCSKVAVITMRSRFWISTFPKGNQVEPWIIHGWNGARWCSNKRPMWLLPPLFLIFHSAYQRNTSASRKLLSSLDSSFSATNTHTKLCIKISAQRARLKVLITS